MILFIFFFFQAEDGIRDATVTGVQTCALPILDAGHAYSHRVVGLAGRDAEIAELEAALTGAAEHGAALLVIGEAGIGKTSLLDAAVGQARSRGYRVLTVSGV